VKLRRGRKVIDVDPTELFSTGLATSIIEGSKGSVQFHELLELTPGFATDSSSHHLREKQVSTARGLLLDSFPNLQILKTEGKIMFPFCKFGGLKPLEGLHSRLKEISILTSPLDPEIHLSGRNAVWILTIPSIVRTTLDCSIDSKDFKFLQDHQEVLKKGALTVKDLTLRLDFKGPQTIDQERSNEIILSMTNKLRRLSMNREGTNLSSSFAGISESTASLVSLRVTGLHSKNPLHIFSSLRTLAGDSNLVKSTHLPIHAARNLSIFPPSLVSFRLTSSGIFVDELNLHGLQERQSIRAASVELILAEVLKTGPLQEPLVSIVTY